jgi:4-hydroxymandelate oxidase
MIGSMFMRVNSKCAHQGAPTTAGAVAHDLGGIPESNCGGRSTGRAKIEALPQVVAEVGDPIPGSSTAARRGTDVSKALALRTKAVGIGRPFLWGLGAFRKATVELRFCRAS